MKIVKFQKLKNNQYKLVLDNDLTITLYDDVILAFNLLIDKELNHEKINEITAYNDELKGYYMAVKYITKKLRSEVEIKKYLEKINFEEKIINKTIIKLKKDHIIDDLLFTKSYINDQHNFTLKGPYRIKRELESLGINEDIINTCLDFSNPLYIDHIKKVAAKRINSNHKYSKVMLMQKIKEDLFNLGFEVNDFQADDLLIPSDLEILKKEYLKAQKKYDTKENKNF